MEDTQGIPDYDPAAKLPKVNTDEFDRTTRALDRAYLKAAHDHGKHGPMQVQATGLKRKTRRPLK